MERTKPIKKSRVIEDLHHLQLMALLRELVRERGYKETARELKIDPRTITSSMRAGRLSEKTRWSLERALQYGVGSAAAEQRERNDKLEDRLDKLEGQLKAVKENLQGGLKGLNRLEGRLDKTEGRLKEVRETLPSGLKRLRMSLDGVRKYYAVQRRLIDQRLLVLESGHDGSETGHVNAMRVGTSSTSSGPPCWDPGGLKEQPSAGMTELIFEWRQALTSLMNAEERLRAGVERDIGLLVDRGDRVEAPAKPRVARSVRLSRRRRAHSWIEESTLAAPE